MTDKKNIHYVISHICCFIIFSFIFSSIGCSRSDKKDEAATVTYDLSQVAARLCGKEISAADILERMRALHGDFDASTLEKENWQNLWADALDGEIFDMLLLNEAESADLKVSEAEIESTIEKSRKMLGQDRFNDMLNRRQITENEYRVDLKRKILIYKAQSKILQRYTPEFSMEETQQYYENNKDNFERESGAKLEILRLANEAEAQKAYKQLLAGKDFSLLVQEYSIDKEQPAGARTSWMTYENIREEFREKVRQTEPDKILAPIKTTDGFYVIKIVGKHSGGLLTFEDASEEIQKILEEEDRQKYMDDWFIGRKNSEDLEYVNQEPPPAETLPKG